jgi:FKBP-type peptidyl-prolyl cis-trans isomerase 2
MQSTAKPGDYVTVDYTGTLDDGTVFDTSKKEGRTPLEFIVGGGQVSCSSGANPVVGGQAAATAAEALSLQ